MIIENTNISARVSSTLKEIVNDSDFSHKDAYEIGAKLITLGVARETNNSLDKNPELKRKLNEKEYKQIQERKRKLEKELDNMDEEKNNGQ